MAHESRYGDYPYLFWDLDPLAAVDPEQPAVLARLLSRGTLEDVARFVTRDELRQRLPGLPVGDHTRLFWSRVVGAPTTRLGSETGALARRP